MAKKIRLGVLFGGRSGEHAVSLSSARSVLETLDHDKYQITQIGITEDGDWLVGDDVLSALAEKNYADLSPAVMLPVPSRPEVYSLKRVNGAEDCGVILGAGCDFPGPTWIVWGRWHHAGII